MNLLLWRHATAEDGADDLPRRLTRHGERQAAEVARWLRAHLSGHYRLLVSPAVRTCQTAQALDEKFEILPSLAPGAYPQVLLREAGWPAGGGTVVIVGHQPTLGRTASLLLSGREQAWSFRKAAVWWFRSRDDEEGPQVALRAVVSPDLLLR